MTKKIINQVQEFLTYCGEDRVYQIVNVEVLLKRHPPEAVIGFLTLLREDYKKELKYLLADKQNRSKDKRDCGQEFPDQDGHQHH